MCFTAVDKPVFETRGFKKEHGPWGIRVYPPKPSVVWISRVVRACTHPVHTPAYTQHARSDTNTGTRAEHVHTRSYAQMHMCSHAHTHKQYKRGHAPTGHACNHPHAHLGSHTGASPVRCDSLSLGGGSCSPGPHHVLPEMGVTCVMCGWVPPGVRVVCTRCMCSAWCHSVYLGHWHTIMCARRVCSVRWHSCHMCPLRVSHMPLSRACHDPPLHAVCVPSVCAR